MNCRHHLSAGVKRSLSDTREHLDQSRLRHVLDRSICYQSSLGRLTDYFLAGLCCLELRITAQGHSCSKQILILSIVVYNSHPVLCQGSCLVRADYLSTAEGLNCSKPSYYSIPVGHLGNAHGKHYSYYRYETFRNSSNSE